VPEQSPSLEELWRAYRETGDERPRIEITRRLKPFVLAAARRARAEMGERPRVADLVSAGVVGLLEALERYDPLRGTRLEVFCGWRILGAMYDDQRKFDWAPQAVRSKARRLRALAERLQNATGRPPSDEELAKALGLSQAALRELWVHARTPRPVSLDRAAPPDAEVVDPALVVHGLDPARLLLAAEARTLLLNALKTLPDQHRYVLLLYYFEELTMAQIALVLGVSVGRVSQIRGEALARLLARLGRRKDELLDALS